MVVAGGTNSMSTAPQSWRVLEPGGEPQMWMSPSHPETPDAPAFDMSITVGENTAREMGLTRRDVDEWAAYSHGQAIASIDSGAFEEEIVAVEYLDREGIARTFTVDEHPRRGVTVESLAELKPIHPELDNPTVTAGNASGSTTPPPRSCSPATPSPRRTGCSRWRGSCRGRTPASSPPVPAWARRSRSRRRCNAPVSPSTTSTWSRSTRRSARCRWRRSARSVSTRRS